jgi:hypothetical protein
MLLGLDRTPLKHLKRINPGRVGGGSLALPARINEPLAQGREPT